MKMHGKTVVAVLAALLLVTVACSSESSPVAAQPTAVTTVAADHGGEHADDHDDGGGAAGTTEAGDAPIDAEYSAAGGVVEGPDRLEVALGQVVQVAVTSDTADEVHIHGYDILVDLAPGERQVIAFSADIPGIFEVELEGSGQFLLELVVK